MSNFDDWDDFEMDGSEPQPEATGFGQPETMGFGQPEQSMQNRRLDMPSQPHPQEGFTTPTQPQNEGEPKSFVKVGATLGVLILIVVVLVLFGRSWLMNNSNPATTPKVEDTPKITEKTNNETNSKGKFDNLEGSTATVTTGSLLKVAQRPSFSEVYSRKGVVVDKGMVEVAGKDTYLCGIDILITAGKSTVPVTYYCNKDTYDAVQEGTNLNVYYQIDDNGKIVIVKVTD